MAKIRQFNILHFNKVKNMLSHIFPEENVSFLLTVIGAPTDLIQPLLPLMLKKTPESYIAIGENEQVKAFITLDATKGNRLKWYIKRLFLDENSFNEGKQLVDFAVTRYGAMGADTFCVLVDEDDDTSAGLFSKMCGFRLCSREVLWKVSDMDCESKYNKDNFFTFKNSDNKIISNFYNEGISPHFKFSLEKEPTEFYKTYNFGFSKKTVHKFYLKNNDNTILAYAELQGTDNHDWIVDLIVNKPYEDEYLPILKCIVDVIKNRSKKSNIFVLNRNYMICAKTYEDLFISLGFEKTQVKMLFVKDFYKPLKNEEDVVNPAVIFKEISGKPAFFSSDLQKTD